MNYSLKGLSRYPFFSAFLQTGFPRFQEGFRRIFYGQVPQSDVRFTTFSSSGAALPEQ